MGAQHRHHGPGGLAPSLGVEAPGASKKPAAHGAHRSPLAAAIGGASPAVQCVAAPAARRPPSLALAHSRWVPPLPVGLLVAARRPQTTGAVLTPAARPRAESLKEQLEARRGELRAARARNAEANARVALLKAAVLTISAAREATAICSTTAGRGAATCGPAGAGAGAVGVPQGCGRPATGLYRQAGGAAMSPGGDGAAGGVVGGGEGGAAPGRSWVFIEAMIGRARQVLSGPGGPNSAAADAAAPAQAGDGRLDTLSLLQRWVGGRRQGDGARRALLRHADQRGRRIRRQRVCAAEGPRLPTATATGHAGPATHGPPHAARRVPPLSQRRRGRAPVGGGACI
jgi:hypothetical protein